MAFRPKPSATGIRLNAGAFRPSHGLARNSPTFTPLGQVAYFPDGRARRDRLEQCREPRPSDRPQSKNRALRRPRRRRSRMGSHRSADRDHQYPRRGAFRRSGIYTRSLRSRLPKKIRIDDLLPWNFTPSTYRGICTSADDRGSFRTGRAEQKMDGNRMPVTTGT